MVSRAGGGPARMSRGVTAAMSAVTLAVGVLSVRASEQVRRSAAHVAAIVATSGVTAPVVARPPAVPATSGAASTSAPAASSPVVSGTQSPTAAHVPSAAQVPSVTTRTSAAPPRVVSTASTPPAATTVLINGAAADTPYGPVQVQIAVRAGRVLRSEAVTYPVESGLDQQINGQAIPILDREAVHAQSAQIDTVSGASFTSAAYQQSLQSALDAAHTAGLR